jgi:hypothetical protein
MKPPPECLNIAKEAERLVQVMDQAGLPITHIGLLGPVASTNIIGIKAGFNRLKKQPEGTYDTISLVSSLARMDSPSMGWSFYMSYLQNDLHLNRFSISFEIKYIDSMFSTSFLNKLINNRVYNYGFAISLNKEDGADTFVLVGPVANNEKNDILSRKWYKFRMKNEPIGDKIRDIYPVNYLNERHLALPVGSRTFKDVLLAYGATSTRQIAGLAEYVLPMDSIDPVRDIMGPTGHVICLAP